MPEQVEGAVVTPEDGLEAQEELVVEAETKEVSTDRAINAPLEEVDDADTLKKMVKKLRSENARARTKNREEQTELDAFRAWKESQMTEQEKLQARLAAAEARVAEAERRAVLSEFGIDDDLAEFVTGSPEEMREKAERLAAKTAKKDGLVPQLFDNSSRSPVSPKKDDGGTFLEFLAQNGRFSL